jgi:hypothetical protein
MADVCADDARARRVADPAIEIVIGAIGEDNLVAVGSRAVDMVVSGTKRR